jgi:hypothetical protein
MCWRVGDAQPLLVADRELDGRMLLVAVGTCGINEVCRMYFTCACFICWLMPRVRCCTC